MLRSMSSAISGLREHQAYMDVVANNIANVNTTGYKASRVDFKDAISQTMSTGAGPTATAGGTNPIQIGLGLTLGGIDNIMTQGNLVSTGKNTDLAIQGEGFFMLGTGAPTGTLTPAYFTRDGAFTLDEQGYLVDTATGDYVLNATGNGPIKADSTWASFSIGPDGKLNGVLADGTPATGTPPQIGLMKFNNPEGLVRVGGNMFQAGPNSGSTTTTPPTAAFGAPGDATTGVGSLVAGSLEASNVDLAEQFSNMIMAQRGFEANSKAITTSDQMLQTLVNMKQ